MKNGLWTLLKRPYAGDDFFLPDLCSSIAVFTMVILAELVVLLWVLAEPGGSGFDWMRLAMASLFVQWVVLLSAALLCRLRPWMQRQALWLSIAACYAVVVGLTLLFTVLANWVLLQGMLGTPLTDFAQLLRHGLIALIMTSLLLRYFYLQLQWQHQQQAELRARLQALQSRIRPHFLFNSLNSIVSLIGTAPDKAENAVLDLADLFRANLTEVEGVATWGEERRLCEGYLRIEQYRLDERLQASWQVSGLPDATPMPLLTLQPILENAIFYGVQPNPQGGDILIRGRRENDRVELEVSNSVCAQEPAGEGAHMALDNIRARLQALFGQEARLDAWQEDSRYFCRVVYSCKQGPSMRSNH
ncbi:sensor histidine kinase [Halopseudomonas salegens]|uniref:Sensory transduction protein kinase AlgZ n=1 Tax=Halopseudomonas salegens TaxID=1434072 RepID=A0A1H2E2L6_9GAMM|nr:histidine kinase [Halopseudomonas salegens]SDT89360.1 Sensory transduction protein kinase AlgZ [Halopseudomonas salegens]